MSKPPRTLPSQLSLLSRRCVAATVLVAPLLLFPARGGGQEVGPPVVEYRERGIGTFDIRNNALYPMNVVIEPFGFVQDSIGTISYVAFDTSAVKLRLSAMSLRVPPRSTLSVSYEVSSRSLPAWFVITSTFAGAKRQGVSYNFQLPHVVYLHQKAPVAKSDVRLSDVTLDTAAKLVRFRVTNASTGLTRCREGQLLAPAAKSMKASVPAFPLFPGFARWMAVEWPHGAPPTKLRLSCTGVELDFDRLLVTIGRPGVEPTHSR